MSKTWQVFNTLFGLLGKGALNITNAASSLKLRIYLRLAPLAWQGKAHFIRGSANFNLSDLTEIPKKPTRRLRLDAALAE